MHQQPVGSAEVSTINPSSGTINTKQMIESDLAKVKRRDYGIGRRLHTVYGLNEGEINEVTRLERSNSDEDAKQILLDGLDHLKRLAESGKQISGSH